MPPPGSEAGEAARGGATSNNDNNGYTISPLHAFLFGASALGSGALVTAALSYKQAAKQLRAEGINPRVRRAILPHALHALIGSLVLTGCVGAAGYAGLRAAGVLRSDEAGLPSLSAAARMFLTGQPPAASRDGGTGAGAVVATAARLSPARER